MLLRTVSVVAAKASRLWERLVRYGRNAIYCKKMILGPGSTLYEGAEIINMQSPDKIIVGKGSHIDGQLMVFPFGEGISIGDNSYVGRGSIVRAGDRIEIGSNVLISHNVNVIDTDSHEIDYRLRAESTAKQFVYGIKEKGTVETSPIVIKDYAWLSYNVSVLKGVTIGKGAIIGCGSVVTHDIPDMCLAAGNPAKVIKYFD